MRIALDFDGVLHSYVQGFTGATDLPGLPVAGALAFVRKAIAGGHDVVVFSCRARTVSQAVESDPRENMWEPGGYEAIVEWLRKHDFPPLKVLAVKPIADVYIDDYGLRFEGRWPSLEKLTSLRPWYKVAHRAMKSLYNGGLTGEREQQILTPSSVTDFVRSVFGTRIYLDPCAADDPLETVDALYRLTGPHTGGLDGLNEPWSHHTFVNPPFGKLKAWLAKAVEESEELDFPAIVLLCPVRSRSGWWRAAKRAAKSNGAYVELNRISFVGYTGTYPESLGLMCFNIPEAFVRVGLERHKIGEIG